MDPRMIPRGGSKEEYNYDQNAGGPGRPNEAGVYFHPQAGKFIETYGVERPDGSTTYAQDSGKIQGDAFAQIGYRPATKEEAAEFRARKEARAKEMKVKANSTTTVMGSNNERK